MASSIDPSALPGQRAALDHAHEVYSQSYMDNVEEVVEIAKKTGSGSLVKSAEQVRDFLKNHYETIRNILGKEGDSADDDGTLEGAYAAQKKIVAVFGGEA